jgi:hypothetical protein
MKRVLVCLGLLLMAVCAGAQKSTPEALKDNPARTADGQSLAHSTSATPARSTDQAQSGASSPSDQKQSTEHHTHVHLGVIGVGAGFGYSSGFYPYRFPYYSPYYPFSPAAWTLWDPFWGFYPPVYPDGYFGRGNGKGEVRLTNAPKKASVYLNGGYAGTVQHLKSFWLDPGVYDLEVVATDGRTFQQRVYVLTGKSLAIAAKPTAQADTGEKL